MLREQCKNGMKVLFGRSRGEKTLGKIVKMNPSKAVVEILEQRGRGRGSEVGSQWRVPYSMMEPAEGETVENTPAPSRPRRAIQFNPFQDAADQHIMEAILCCYANLSPENLTCDGELPAARVRQRSAELHRKLRGLFQALGQEVSETDAYDWEQQRREWEQSRKKA